MRSYDADPLRYLRGAVACLLGAGTLVAFVLGVSGIAPRALLLALVLWAAFGLLTGVVDFVLEPAAELIGGLLANAGSGRASPQDRLAPLLEEAARPRAAWRDPGAIARDLKALQRSRRLTPADDIRLGLALAELYEQELDDPGRALGELRRLLDRHASLRRSVQVRELLQGIRARHFAAPAQ